MTFEIRNACLADARGIAAVVRESFPASTDERVYRRLRACLANLQGARLV
jgi:hypothetical protein